MYSAYAGEVMNKAQTIIIETGNDPSWQDQVMTSLQQTVGPWGVTGLVISAFVGGGFFLYKKKFKK